MNTKEWWQMISIYVSKREFKDRNSTEQSQIEPNKGFCLERGDGSPTDDM